MLWFILRDPQHIVCVPRSVKPQGNTPAIAPPGTTGFVVFGPYEKLWYNEDRWQ